MNFDYKKICDNLLKGLPQRTADVIEKRFGLKGGEGQTLEAIGSGYGITRERVRQIAEEGFSNIRPRIKECQKTLQYFNDALKSFGDLKKEETFLTFLGGKKYQNQVSFLLALDNKNFKRISEDKDFYSFWTRKDGAVALAKEAVELIAGKFESGKAPLNLDNLFLAVKNDLSKILGKRTNKTILGSYLEIPKKIQANAEGNFGLRDWVEINPRGIKDKAYLVLKRGEKPLHFAQVALMIEKLPVGSQKKVHVATVHNELIKDQRFVLVGRGLYALKEWGFEPGVVKDVILSVLRKAKNPLTKEEIIRKVSEQRFVKGNTISLNLRDKNFFLQNQEGKYTVKEA